MPLRDVLAESNIAVVAVAVLLLGALESALHGLWSVLARAIDFVVYIVITLNISYLSNAMSYSGRVYLTLKVFYFFYALMGFFAASILSRWVYGVGPIRSLAQHWTSPKKGSRA